jgi:hypothetical protein
MSTDDFDSLGPMAATQLPYVVTDSNVTPVMLPARARLSVPRDGILPESGK